MLKMDASHQYRPSLNPHSLRLKKNLVLLSLKTITTLYYNVDHRSSCAGADVDERAGGADEHGGAMATAHRLRPCRRCESG